MTIMRDVPEIHIEEVKKHISSDTEILHGWFDDYASYFVTKAISESSKIVRLRFIRIFGGLHDGIKTVYWSVDGDYTYECPWCFKESI